MPPRRYKRAQKATPLQLYDAIPAPVPRELTVSVYHATNLSQDLRDDVFDIFTVNMKELYTGSSSFGWSPQEKQNELFHEDSRFILLMRDGKLQAYTMFRFDNEEGLDVLYCYELQVCPDAQRQGLGRFLVKAILALATKWKMDSVMLTVLRANEQAAQFYRAVGFKVDPSSPTFVDPDEDASEHDTEMLESDYEILSMPIIGR